MSKYDDILKQATDAIERRFGTGYAIRNPRVLTSLMNAVATSDELEISKAANAAKATK
jgi:hypothetical protein